MADLVRKPKKAQKVRKHGDETRLFNDPYWVFRQVLREWRENLTETLPDKTYGLIVDKDPNYIQQNIDLPDTVLSALQFFNFNKPITVFKIIPLDRTIEIEPTDLADQVKIDSMNWYLPENNEALENCAACNVGDIIVIEAPDKARTTLDTVPRYVYKSPFLSISNSIVLSQIGQVAADAKRRINQNPVGRKITSVLGSLFADKRKKFSSPEKQRIINVFQKFKDLLPDLTDNQIAGIIGNLLLESNLSPEVENSIGAFGIAQWLDPKGKRGKGRRGDLEAFARKKTQPVTSLDLQLLFIKEELFDKEKGVLPRLKTATTVEQAAKVWRVYYERPAEFEARDDLRSTYAEQALDIYISKDIKSDLPEVSSTQKFQTDKQKIARSEPRNYPFLEFIRIEADFSKANKLNTQLGSKFFSVREDLKTPIDNIKNIMNSYGVPFTVNAFDFNVSTKNISYFARIGMQVSLNKYSGLNPDGNILTDEYLISPDFSRQVNRDIFPYVIWGRIKSNQKEIIKNEEVFDGELKVLDIANSYKTNSRPEIKKVKGKFLNITKLFQQNGFNPVLGKKEFYYNSILESSYWNIFEYHNGLTPNVTTYGELLSKSYINNNEEIWQDSKKIWNGKQFIG